MKIALVHDDFIQKGGAESLFATIAEIFPDAPIYTSLVNYKKLPSSINAKRINTSFMQRIPFAKIFYKAFLPLYPLAFESFGFSLYDIVISSTTRFSKSIITSPNTAHICYINSVPRFLWEKEKEQEYLPKFVRLFIKPYLNWLKRYDKATSARVDLFIANSKSVAEKVEKYYSQKAEVVYPFVNTKVFQPPKSKSGDYYLVVTRLVEWKKVENAITAAKNLNINLKIVGTGPDKSRLKKLANDNPNVDFLERVTKEELVSLYQNAKALIVTQEEDFGLSALEAQSCGTPVIAFAKGGVTEIVENGKTGILYKQQSSKSLEDAIVKAKEVKWEIQQIATHAHHFTKTNFVNSLKRQAASYEKQSQ